MDLLIRYDWEWVLPASPEAMWPLVADTSRFNRDTGLNPVQGDTPGFCTTRNGRRNLRTRAGGLVIDWEEDPFEWERPWRFAVVRRYRRGPLREMRVFTELHEHEQGCRLTYTVHAWPRAAVLVPAVRAALGVVAAARFGRAFRSYAQHLSKTTSASATIPVLPPLAARPLVSGAAAQRLERSAATLGDSPAVERLVALLERGDDMMLARLQPYLLADAWQLPRRDVLTLFLHATRAGLLELRWDVICPLCRGAKAVAGTLSELAEHAYCECCHIQVDAALERAVELTFRPAPSVRAVAAAPYCVGGPGLTPHIVVQQRLAAGETRVVRPRLEPGVHRLRCADDVAWSTFRVAEDGARAVELVLGAADLEETVASEPELTLRNPTAAEQLFVIERIRWADYVVTPADLLRLPVFRDLFSREVLRPGQHFAVGSVSVLFTDLCESTRMYREFGDAPAFARVRDHFDVLRSAIEPEDGAIIKTIGDAVMAVFGTPAMALRALHRAYAALEAQPLGVRAVQLKAGLHTGACIAVTLNDRLDFFGTSVNIAARLGGAAGGGEVVVSEEVLADPEVAGVLRELGVIRSADALVLRGVSDDAVRVHRLRSALGAQ